MKISITNVFVEDQEKACQFYTNTLGFVIKNDIALGNGDRRLTVVSPDDNGGTQLLLEPLSGNHFPPAKVYQQALYDAGMPYTQFHVDDIDDEYERLQHTGVIFKSPPTDIGDAKIAVFDDTCGNYIMLVEPTT